MTEENPINKPTFYQPQSQPQQIPTSIGDLLKLYMQQFGNLTFGTVTLFLLWQFMVRPQMELNQETIKAQREVLEILHKHAESLQLSAIHMSKTVEMQDRQLLKAQQE